MCIEQTIIALFPLFLRTQEREKGEADFRRKNEVQWLAIRQCKKTLYCERKCHLYSTFDKVALSENKPLVVR